MLLWHRGLVLGAVGRGGSRWAGSTLCRCAVFAPAAAPSPPRALPVRRQRRRPPLPGAGVVRMRKRPGAGVPLNVYIRVRRARHVPLRPRIDVPERGTVQAAAGAAPRRKKEGVGSTPQSVIASGATRCSRAARWVPEGFPSLPLVAPRLPYSSFAWSRSQPLACTQDEAADCAACILGQFQPLHGELPCSRLPASRC